ncbi:MAG: Spy/CpxP family protein refolding chaperone [Gammaproteobacteria bacterium]|nr:Spy/CpxP family protein refolding chaperone [Gammaproteobacteria bacterium]
MKRSTKIIVALVAVAGIGAATFATVSAQGGGWGGCRGYGPASYEQGENPMMGRRGYGMKHGRNWGDREKMITQRLEVLKSELQITEEQEPAWQAFNQALVEKMQAKAGRFGQRGAQVPVSARVERMRSGAKSMTELADAMEKFYGVLTPEQQKLADQMRPMGRRF